MAICNSSVPFQLNHHHIIARNPVEFSNGVPGSNEKPVQRNLDRSPPSLLNPRVWNADASNSSEQYTNNY